MKKAMLALAMFGIAVAGFGQKSAPKKRVKDQNWQESGQTSPREFLVFGELTVSRGATRDDVKFHVPEVVSRTTRDQKLLNDAQAAMSYRFRSATEALNIFSSQGWSLESVYKTKGPKGDVIHYVMAIKTVLGDPFYPWQDSEYKARMQP